MNGMEDLVTWLRAQLDEDKRVARQVMAEPGGFYIEAETDDVNVMTIGAHVYRWTPKRVLAEVEAKRRILDLADDATSLDMSVDMDRRVGRRDETKEPYVGDEILRQLALPYDDRPGYREEWRPSDTPG